MKRFIAIGAMALVMTSCVTPSNAALNQASAVATTTEVRVEGPTFIQKLETEKALKQKQRELHVRDFRMKGVISKLKKRVGKTAYVFSGVTPSGWDCSGLVVWAYEQLGVELPHSANKQGHLGKKVKTPKIGDIVVFSYKGSKSYYHASIYIGNNKVIHAGFRPGTSTSIISLDDSSFDTSDETFIRVNW